MSGATCVFCGGDHAPGIELSACNERAVDRQRRKIGEEAWKRLWVEMQVRAVLPRRGAA